MSVSSLLNGTYHKLTTSHRYFQQPLALQALRLSKRLQAICCGTPFKRRWSSKERLLFVWCVLFSPTCVPNWLLLGGQHKYRSPQEFYPHLHWLYRSAQGVKGPCICQYCDHSKSQEEINKIFYLPPHRESTKGPRGLKKVKQTRKLRGPKGATTQRAIVKNRNSITTGPVTSLGGSRKENCKLIGYSTSHPFTWQFPVLLLFPGGVDTMLPPGRRTPKLLCSFQAVCLDEFVGACPILNIIYRASFNL